MKVTSNPVKLSLTLFLFFVCALSAFSQGVIRGTVKDAKNQEAIIGATVLVEGTQLGAATDIEGNFTIAKVPAGTYNLKITYISYKAKDVKGLRVENDNVTVVETEIEEDSKTLETVVVRANKQTNTEVAVITEIKQIKAIAVGISAQQISKSQDRDAAAAIRRVAGVSLFDDRFVMVRGLSQRYNSVLINDLITPSTEVDTRAFSFDMLPSNIIDRMIVFKSGTADLPGDFAGGVVKIFTKKKPDQNFTSANVSLGFRGNTTLQSVQNHDRGSLSALGMWDAASNISTAFPQSSQTFNELSPLQRASYAHTFPNNWALTNSTVAPDIRLGINAGRVFDLGNLRVSTLSSVNYSNTHQLADAQLRIYQNALTANDVNEKYEDRLYTNNTRLGVLSNWTFRFSPTFTLEFKNLFNQLGFKETNVREGQFVANQNLDIRSISQRFESRSIGTSQLSGKHALSPTSELNWIAGFGYTGRWEPDWRRIRYIRQIGITDEQGRPVPFQVSNPIDPTPTESGRFFSKLNEFSYTLAANYERKLNNPEDRTPSVLKTGVYLDRKNRNFDARFYGYNNIGNVSSRLSLPVEQIYDRANVTGQVGGFTMKDGTRDIDSYTGSNTLVAAYVSTELALSKKALLTAGFRGEYNDQRLERALKIFSPLPSINFSYKLNEKNSVRLAYSFTINRPEFREIAPFSYFDFNFNADVRGNVELTTATIQNLDAKWEFYPTDNEMITVTGFFKRFRNPIESFLIPTGNGLAYTFINAKDATNYGVELEMRKGFNGAGSRFLQNLQIVANASIIASRINLGESILAPDLSGATQTYNLTGITESRRPMMNQSPYLINTGLFYDNRSGFTANVLYNVAGPRIFAVGNIDNATIYEMPRNVIDVNLSKQFGKKVELRLSIQDILNQPVRLSQDFNRDGKIGKDITSQTANADQDIRSFRRGTYSSLSLVYNF
ncbi:MAG: TonB-dependent receptor [Spirosomaceae bacterium]|nr:TonB-dependent receptor [Spirosomataceae bacterium]